VSLRFSYRPEFPARYLAEEDVAACEEMLGVRMPPAFRRFLLSHDGPMPDPAWLRIGDRPEWVGPMISFFTVMDPASPKARRDTIESYTSASRELEGLPAEYLCVGLLLRQPSTLLLSTARPTFGAVSAWRVTPRRRFDPGQAVRVADSFEGLLAAFADPPDAVAAADPEWVRDLRRARFAPLVSPE
jgi:hypothetical protein